MLALPVVLAVFDTAVIEPAVHCALAGAPLLLAVGVVSPAPDSGDGKASSALWARFEQC